MSQANQAKLQLMCGLLFTPFCDWVISARALVVMPWSSRLLQCIVFVSHRTWNQPHPAHPPQDTPLTPVRSSNMPWPSRYMTLSSRFWASILAFGPCVSLFLRVVRVCRLASSAWGVISANSARGRFSLTAPLELLPMNRAGLAGWADWHRSISGHFQHGSPYSIRPKWGRSSNLESELAILGLGRGRGADPSAFDLE